MMQKWQARWQTLSGEPCEHQFVCLKQEAVARIGLLLELKRLDLPFPAKYDLERIGEPYDVHEGEVSYEGLNLLARTLVANHTLVCDE
jgi:hypothetical protein